MLMSSTLTSLNTRTDMQVFNFLFKQNRKNFTDKISKTSKKESKQTFELK